MRDDPNEHLHFHQLRSSPGVEVLAASSSFQPWHVFHERYAFPSRRTAAAGWLYRGRTHFMKDGSTSFLEPGETHRNTEVHKRSDFKVLFVPQKLLEIYGRERGSGTMPHFQIAQTDDPRVHHAVYSVCLAAEASESDLEIETKLTSCLDLLLSYAEHGAPAKQDLNVKPAIERAKRLLLDKFSEAVSLRELCVESGLSRFHLVRSFRRHFGLPPHAYQVHVRIERARTLLQAGMPPAEVSESVGFADQSHFSRHFRKIMRVSPGRYANCSR